jgi:N-acetylneuraminate 9-O-acetyltransferase
LSKGRWVHKAWGRYNERKFHKWQPQGCLLFEYKAEDIKKCAEDKRLVFVGDSTTRQIFWATAKKLNKGGAKKDMELAEKNNKHTDLTFSHEGVDLEFVWDPYMNTTRLQDELATYKTGLVMDGSQDGHNKDTAIILIGGGLWHARHVEEKALETYKNAVDAIVPYIDHRGLAFPRVTMVNPPNLRKGSGNLLLFTPVQVPDYHRLSPSRAATILPEKVASMNDYLLELSSRHGLEVLWSYSLMTWKHKAAYEESGLHVVENVAERRADVLLNMRCNSEANVKEYPHNRTCCAAYPSPGWEQIVGLVFALVVMPATLLLTYLRYRRTRVGAKRGFQHVSFAKSHELVFALFVFSSAICYCYYADRSWLFEKTQKVFWRRSFLTLCGLSFATGAASVRLTTTRPPASSSSQAKSLQQDQPFLSREQTDEWKGWMQCVVLIYHYLGASKVLWIYEIIRLMVAAYLFMTGFGHGAYFYKTDDYSLRRVASVLIRLNLLACVLPYAMRTDYLFYYFAPLVSFWFVIIYFTMRLGHSRNGNIFFLVGKMTLSATLTTSFIKIPGLLEALFKFLEITCRIKWDVKEWRFRVFLDMYIVYIGLLVGVIYVQLTSTSLTLSKNRFTSLVRTYFHPLQVLAVVASLAILPNYFLLVHRSHDKYDYNWWQPYISSLPIISYIILRNSNRMFRNIHSRVFAWLGRCSLETFTLQFHIWLGADTKGLLSLGLFSGNGDRKGQWIEFIIITAIFLWTSWWVGNATNTLTNWIVDPRKKPSGVQSPSGHLRTKSEITQVLPSPNKSEAGVQALGDSPGSEKKCRWVGALKAGQCDERLEVRLVFMLVGMWALNWVRFPYSSFLFTIRDTNPI